MLDHTQAVVGVCVGAVTILAALFGWVRWLRPGFKKIRADFITGRDTLVGRDAVVDTVTGRELAPAVPGVGVQLATLSDNVTKIVDVVLEDHEQRIKRLEAAAVERVAAKAESVAAFRAMEAIAYAEPPEPPEDN